MKTAREQKKEEEATIRIEKNKFGEVAKIKVFGEYITIAKIIRENSSFIESIGIHNNKSIGVIWFDEGMQTQINSGFEAEKLKEIEKAVEILKNIQ